MKLILIQALYASTLLCLVAWPMVMGFRLGQSSVEFTKSLSIASGVNFSVFLLIGGSFIHANLGSWGPALVMALAYLGFFLVCTCLGRALACFLHKIWPNGVFRKWDWSVKKAVCYFCLGFVLLMFLTNFGSMP
jgi:hypothetical protein